MSDLIDRTEAYKVLTEYYHHKTETQHEALKEALNRVPSVEPKKGKWITDCISLKTYVYRCSECRAAEVLISNYCPKCGAKMEV